MNATDSAAHGCEPEKSDANTNKLWLGFPAIFLIWTIYYCFQSPVEKDSPFDRLNTLFSGFAFWGVVFAILPQKSELALQRRELKFTRKEVRGQKEQLQAQNATFIQQRFENTSFSLLELFMGIVDSIEIWQTPRMGNAPQPVSKGRHCFSRFITDFQTVYAQRKSDNPDWDDLRLCMSAYEGFTSSRQTYVGHYFRTLYNIVKFIETSELQTKQFYVNLVRSQLSSDELTLLFYNCLSKFGNETFKPYVQKYGILENMDFSKLLDQQHRDLYEESAFKSHL